MNCKEFWEKWTLSEDIDLQPELKAHLDSCHRCNKEISLLNEGISKLKKEIFDEEPASFWHDMKDEIYKQVKVPKKKKWIFTWSWKSLWILAPTLMAVFLFFLFTMKTQVMFNSEDIYLLAGGVPASTISISINQELEEYTNNEQLDEEAFIGISDPMAALLIETS